jgi:hypothetical protein
VADLTGLAILPQASSVSSPAYLSENSCKIRFFRDFGAQTERLALARLLLNQRKSA